MSASFIRRLFCSCLLLACPSARAAEPATKPLNDKVKEIAGTAEFLRRVPKHFATLKAVDPARGCVTFLIEGESLPKVWPLVPDAEVKIAGWWGRLDQLVVGDRVWVWFKTDRVKQSVAVATIADELSEQDMHGPGVHVEARGDGTITLKPVKGANRVVKTANAETRRGQSRATLDTIKTGDRVYVQCAGERARLILDPAAFEARRATQKSTLRQRWSEQGLPGTAAFVHTFSGEMDFMLDHEAMRWGRSLKAGDKVTLQVTPAIEAVVKHVQPWRERTQLRLVVNSFDLADLVAGQRFYLRMPPPSAEVENSLLPPDLGQRQGKQERVEWFLASIYCTCPVKGDRCTGMFYTLASCNPNGCGMPNAMRKHIGKKIDRGLSDRQIFEEMLKTYGPTLTRPHLLP